MTLSSQDRDEFAVRFYEWSLGKLFDELATEFERIVKARVNDRAYVAALARTAQSERKATAISCLKRFHPRGAELSGDPLSPQEQTLLDKFETVRTQVRADQNLNGFIGGALFRARPGAAQIRRCLVKHAKEELPGALGEPDEADSRSRFWSYSTKVKGYPVRTKCDATGSERHYDFAYGHRIGASGEQPLELNVSWMAWLGISGPSEWRLSDEDEIPTVIAAVKDVTREFFEALPAILPDLNGQSGE